MTANQTLKRIAFVLLTIGLAAVPMTAETVVNGIEWESPTLQAQGNSAGGLSGGWDALFTNPALYAAEDSEMTFLSLNAGGIFDPYKLNEDADQEIAKVLLNQVTTNGIGARVQLGGGWVGKGFGIAFPITLAFNAPKAETVLGATVNLDFDHASIFGYSHKFEPVDELSLAVGGDLQILSKIRFADLGVGDVMKASAGSSGGGVSNLLKQFDNVQSGWAVGGNLGTAVEWRYLRGSLAIRDIGHTRYHMSRTSPDKLSIFGSGTKLNISFIVPMTMRIGFGIDPDWDRFNPRFHMEYIQPLATEVQSIAAGYGSFLTRLNTGAELGIFNMLFLRGGLRSGYLTAGFGLDLFVFEMNAAIWAQETGFYPGDAPQMAGSLEIAFRY